MKKGGRYAVSARPSQWIRFGKTDEKQLKLTDDQRHVIKKLKGERT